MQINESIVTEVSGFHSSMKEDPYHRFRSWEHCYGFFQTNQNDIELASLHLAFYLASWGMYRGSSSLLQKDYRIHHSVVQKMLDARNANLKDLSFDSFSINKAGDIDESSEVVKDIFGLIEWMRSLDNAPYHDAGVVVTDTLATKILLGTLGCMPAYDRFFIDGIRDTGEIKHSQLTPRNFSRMVTFCKKRRAEFEAAQQTVSQNSIKYPLMKIIDMYFWRKGRGPTATHGT
jgi:hypothetical protein